MHKALQVPKVLKEQHKGLLVVKVLRVLQVLQVHKVRCKGQQVLRVHKVLRVPKERRETLH